MVEDSKEQILLTNGQLPASRFLFNYFKLSTLLAFIIGIIGKLADADPDITMGLILGGPVIFGIILIIEERTRSRVTYILEHSDSIIWIYKANSHGETRPNRIVLRDNKKNTFEFKYFKEEDRDAAFTVLTRLCKNVRYTTYSPTLELIFIKDLNKFLSK